VRKIIISKKGKRITEFAGIWKMDENSMKGAVG